MNKLIFAAVIFISASCAIGVAEPSLAWEAGSRPNVLFILADDLGWSDTTLNGTCQYHQTPNIERLARRGMTFSRAYSASPLCSPTRSAILTGLSPARTGITTPSCHLPQVVLSATVGKTAARNQKSIQTNSVTRLHTQYRTLAESFKDAGYATGHFGKWHLGAEPYSPLQHGFEVDLPHHHGPGPAGSYVAPWKFKDFKEKTADEHIEDRMAQEAAAWMRSHAKQPFFLNYWMFSVHAPFDAKRDLIEKHRARIAKQKIQVSPTYAAMIESMDNAVGTLLDTLDELGIAENTIVIFTSDNGGNMYSDVDEMAPTNNRPLRGGKASMFEGGTRVPCVVAWPGVTRAASTSDTPIQSEDYYPTLLEGLGLKPEVNQKFDGQSVLPALRGEQLQHEPLFQFFPHSPAVPDWLPPSVSVHTGDWKLIRIFHGGDNQAHRHLLFNLKDDLGEQHDLSSQMADKVRELDQLIDKFLLEKHAAVPIPNPAFTASEYHPEEEGKSKPRDQKGKATSAESTPATSADNPKMSGWKTRACVADVVDGVAIVKATGKAPFLGFAPGKLQSGAKLRFRIRCDGGTGRVARLPGQNASSAEEPPATEFAVKAGQWTEVSADIPELGGGAGIIRLFLPAQEAPIEIDWIELIQNDKRQRWDFGSP